MTAIGIRAVVLAAALTVTGCGSSSTTADPSAAPSAYAYPAFIDTDGDRINDYVAQATHTPAVTGSLAALVTGVGTQSHDFVDENGDGVCDYAQNGSPTWHGPGYVDADGDGVCDYWQTGNGRYGQGGGMAYADENGDGVCDYAQRQTHQAASHDYVDADGDGVCDDAQSGAVDGWHGPNYVDADGDGVCDLWQEGGRGNGGQMGEMGQPWSGGHGSGPMM